MESKDYCYFHSALWRYYSMFSDFCCCFWDVWYLLNSVPLHYAPCPVAFKNFFCLWYTTVQVKWGFSLIYPVQDVVAGSENSCGSLVLESPQPLSLQMWSLFHSLICLLLEFSLHTCRHFLFHSVCLLTSYYSCLYILMLISEDFLQTYHLVHSFSLPHLFNPSTEFLNLSHYLFHSRSEIVFANYLPVLLSECLALNSHFQFLLVHL